SVTLFGLISDLDLSLIIRTPGRGRPAPRNLIPPSAYANRVHPAQHLNCASSHVLLRIVRERLSFLAAARSACERMCRCVSASLRLCQSELPFVLPVRSKWQRRCASA